MMEVWSWSMLTKNEESQKQDNNILSYIIDLRFFKVEINKYAEYSISNKYDLKETKVDASGNNNQSTMTPSLGFLIELLIPFILGWSFIVLNHGTV